MTKAERIRAAVEGRDVDVVPFSFWSHFPDVDMDPEKLAECTYLFYKTYDVDFIKTMSNGMYSIEDLGCTVDYSGIKAGGVAKLVHTPIQQPSDWERVPLCDLHSGAFAREIRMLSDLMDALGEDDVPVVFTCFSPITTASKLGGSCMLQHIRSGYGAQVHKALDVITRSTEALVRRVTEMGAAGVFFASQMSSYDKLTEEEYLEYGKPYDLRVLNASDGWFNILHAHGENIMFDVLRDYPVEAFNWHAWETLPEIDEARDMTGKCLVGGIQRHDITKRDRNAVRSQIYKCLSAMGRRKLILTPGCVIRYPLDTHMLSYVRQIKEQVEQALFAD